LLSMRLAFLTRLQNNYLFFAIHDLANLFTRQQSFIFAMIAVLAMLVPADLWFALTFGVVHPHQAFQIL
jgi:hypothetical protein